jgi:hypothetical protein
MPAYSQLDEERDQIAFMRAAGRSICALAGGPVKVRYSWGGVTRARGPDGVPRAGLGGACRSCHYDASRQRDRWLGSPRSTAP